jgi:hypothetical protein
MAAQHPKIYPLCKGSCIPLATYERHDCTCKGGTGVVVGVDGTVQSYHGHTLSDWKYL